MNTSEKFKTIGRDALKAKVDKKEKFHLWNVLNKEHYKAGSNIAGSQWVPFDTLNETRAGEKIPAKTDTVVLYCGGGDCTSSKKAAGKLASYGYTAVFTYKGGVKDWSEAGFPLVKA